MRKAGYIETTLSTEQKLAAVATLESCINNSDFALPNQLYDPSGLDGSYTRKYSKQNDPLRLYVCIAKGALQNVCIIYLFIIFIKLYGNILTWFISGMP